MLKWYEHPYEDDILSLDSGTIGIVLSPGSLVTHVFDDSRIGILVAIVDDRFLVLWTNKFSPVDLDLQGL